MGAGASVTDKKVNLAKKGFRSLEEIKNLHLLQAMDRLEVLYLHKNALTALSSKVSLRSSRSWFHPSHSF